MAQYMLLIRDDMNGYSRYTRDELTALIGRMGEWSARLKQAGIHRGAEKLTDDPGRVLRKKEGRIVLDGPFAEARELVGGFFLIEARGYDEAAEIAAQCPALEFASQIEIREVAGTCQGVVARGRQ